MEGVRPVWRPRGFFAGAILGVVSVVASGLLSAFEAPPAYGLCVACHGRDLLASLGLQGWVGTAGASGVVLTTAGLLAGAAIAAMAHREQRRRPARRPLRSALLGALTMVAALFALGCMTRLALRAAYGDSLAIWSLSGAAAGIAGVTGLMTWLARR